jgi:saccharopine dehydrogenase (NADP+, L-glutamate forming)
LAIAARLLLEGKIKARGVVVPVTKEFYDPILAELKTLGVELGEN